MKVKAVLFDVDDTLFDREKAQATVLYILVKRFPEILSRFTPQQLMEAWLASDRIATADFETNIPSEILRNSRSRVFVRLLGISQDYVFGAWVRENYF